MTALAAAPGRLEGRRRRLLGAALALFSERGYHDSSVDDVVAAARMSKSAFYQYFDSKQHCCRVLLEIEGGALLNSVLAAALGPGDHRTRLRRGVHGFVEACFSRAPVARLLLVESVGLSESIERVRHQIHGDFAGMVEAEIRRAQADGELTGIDPVVYGRAVVGAANEATAWFLQAGGNPAGLAAELCRIFAI